MSRMLAILAISAAVVVAPAKAETIWLDCRASGDAGAADLQLVVDESAHAVTAIWKLGRPGSQPSGSDTADNPNISPAEISAAFFPYGPGASEYSYILQVSRLDGTFRYTRNMVTSFGTCRKSAKPNAIF